MHEASLVQGLLGMAEKALNEYNEANPLKKGAGIREIRCSYGLLACFEPETLKACFEILSENTLAEGARLELQTEPLPCECKDCGAKFLLLERSFHCPQCNGGTIAFSGGNGLTLLAIDVEEDISND